VLVFDVEWREWVGDKWAGGGIGAEKANDLPSGRSEHAQQEAGRATE
jgi:hypothetical protein